MQRRRLRRTRLRYYRYTHIRRGKGGNVCFVRCHAWRPSLSQLFCLGCMPSDASWYQARRSGRRIDNCYPRFLDHLGPSSASSPSRLPRLCLCSCLCSCSPTYAYTWAACPVLAGCSCMPRVKGKPVRRTVDDDVVFGAPLFPTITISQGQGAHSTHRLDYRRYAGQLHTSLHAALALAPTPRASQQPCRATPKPALTTPARPLSRRAPCSSRCGRSFRRAPSPRSTASSWTAWYFPEISAALCCAVLRCAVHRG